MRFLLDECCAPALAQALRSAGHDVRHALEDHRGIDDEALVALAADDQRIVITEDKDFGALVVRRGRSLPGLILLRIEPRDRHLKTRRLLMLLAQDEARLIGSYAVVEVASVRLRPLPTLADIDGNEQPSCPKAGAAGSPPRIPQPAPTNRRRSRRC